MTRIANISFQSPPTTDQITSEYSDTSSLSIQEKIALLREKVYAERPILANIMAIYGGKTLFEYSKSYTRTNFAFENEQRKSEFIAVFRNEVARLLGEELAQSAEEQLSRYYTVSTAEHNAPITHTNYLNANLISSLPLLDPISPELKNIFVLSCANISFDNYAFPRGLLLTSITGEEATTQELVFFPRSVRSCPVVYHPAYTKESIENAKQRISQWIREGSISKAQEKKLLGLLDEVYGTEDVLNTSYFTEQITKTNYLLWKKLFEGSEVNTPNLIFLEQERIVNTLLLTHHMNKKTTIGKLLFDKRYHKLFLKYFNALSNAFDLDKKAGTVYFWALPPGKKYREQLWYEKGFLVTESGEYRVALTPESIMRALSNKELIPSTPLSFILLSFYYGLRLRGAFEQTTYLTAMKDAYIAMLRELDDLQGIADCLDTPTTTLSFIKPILALGQTSGAQIIPAGTLDLLFNGIEHALYQIQKIAKSITLDDAVTRVLPLLYKRIYPEHLQNPYLAGVSESEIDQVLGIDGKLQPVVIFE